ncbi:hypothetical protein KR067_003766 [Drosophila pandora]|nr:hypothetical protein KR067_003766 [Drosophila pandora]
MDGYYQGNSGYFNSSGYSQRSVNKNYGSCCNCSGGNCSRMGAGASQMQSQSMSQLSCPGGNCCPGGRCPIGKTRLHSDWQNRGR